MFMFKSVFRMKFNDWKHMWSVQQDEVAIEIFMMVISDMHTDSPGLGPGFIFPNLRV